MFPASRTCGAPGSMSRLCLDPLIDKRHGPQLDVSRQSHLRCSRLDVQALPGPAYRQEARSSTQLDVPASRTCGAPGSMSRLCLDPLIDKRHGPQLDVSRQSHLRCSRLDVQALPGPAYRQEARSSTQLDVPASRTCGAPGSMSRLCLDPLIGKRHGPQLDVPASRTCGAPGSMSRLRLDPLIGKRHGPQLDVSRQSHLRCSRLDVQALPGPAYRQEARSSTQLDVPRQLHRKHPHSFCDRHCL